MDKLTAEQTLLVYLVTGSSALIGLQGSRVYPAPLPERATLPATTFVRIPGNEYLLTHGGMDSFGKHHYQLDVWAKTRLSARQVGDALVNTLNNWTGTHSYVNDDFDMYETETALHRVIIDCTFWK